MVRTDRAALGPQPGLLPGRGRALAVPTIPGVAGWVKAEDDPGSVGFPREEHRLFRTLPNARLPARSATCLAERGGGDREGVLPEEAPIPPSP